MNLIRAEDWTLMALVFAGFVGIAWVYGLYQEGKYREQLEVARLERQTRAAPYKLPSQALPDVRPRHLSAEELRLNWERAEAERAVAFHTNEMRYQRSKGKGA